MGSLQDPTADRHVLLDFPDGLLVRTRLQSRPDKLPNVSAVDLSQPLEAWRYGELSSLLAVDSRRGTRRFCTLPVPPKGTESLDLSTLEEALTSAKRPGGLGSIAILSRSELRVHLKRLEEVMQSFDGPEWHARKKRLDDYLAAAQDAIEERTQWETFLTEHPVFRESLQAAIAAGREELQKKMRAELLAEEQQLEQKLHRLNREWEELEGVKATTERDVKKIQTELSILEAERLAHIAAGSTHSRGGIASDNGKGHGTMNSRARLTPCRKPRNCQERNPSRHLVAFAYHWRRKAKFFQRPRKQWLS